MGEEAAPAEAAGYDGNIDGELLASYALEEGDVQESQDEESPDYGGKSIGRKPTFYALKGMRDVERHTFQVQSHVTGRQIFSAEQNLDEVVENEPAETHGEVRERTPDGAVAIIAYQDPETGKVTEYLLEENPASYALPEYAGKLRFIGGAIDRVNGKKEDPYTTLERELYEEVPSREAVQILLKYLDSRTPYKTVKVDVDGESTETHVFKIIVTNWDHWLVAVGANLGDDAGFSRLVTLEDILTIGKKGFAFDDYEVIHEFATGELPTSAPKEHQSSHPLDNGHEEDEPSEHGESHGHH